MKDKKGKLEVGDSLCFGKYAIDGQNEEPLEWVIIKQERNSSILVSKKIVNVIKGIENKEGIDVTWTNSDVRKWLNNVFYNSAFNNKEKENIEPTMHISKISDDLIDNVSLLDFEQYCEYCDGMLDYDLPSFLFHRLETNRFYYSKSINVFIVNTAGSYMECHEYNGFKFWTSSLFNDEYSCVRPVITVKNSYLENISPVEFDVDSAFNEIKNKNLNEKEMIDLLSKKFPNSYTKNYCIAHILHSDNMSIYVEKICCFHDSDFSYDFFDLGNSLARNSFKLVFKSLLQCVRKNLNLPIEKDIDDPNIQAGDMVSLGRSSYDSLKDSPILWDVINVDNGQALLLCKKLINSKSETFNSKNNGNWATSRFRTYLNDKFYNLYFNDEERAKMIKFTLNNNVNYFDKKIDDLLDYVSFPDTNIINSLRTKVCFFHYLDFEYNSSYLIMDNKGNVMRIDKAGNEESGYSSGLYRPVILIKLNKK